MSIKIVPPGSEADDNNENKIVYGTLGDLFGNFNNSDDSSDFIDNIKNLAKITSDKSLSDEERIEKTKEYFKKARGE